MGLPFYLITFNRLIGLESALEFSKRSTLEIDLVIVDMGSTWAPFVDKLNNTPNKKYYLPNIGPRTLWKNSFLQEIDEGPFFLSDGDLDYSNIPDDAFQKLLEISEYFPFIPKVGLALNLQRIPYDTEGLRVRRWAKYDQKIKIMDEIYLSSVDTTIAYYPKRESTFFYRPALRLGGIYTVEHYPWYERSFHKYPETDFYHLSASQSISSSAQKISKTLKEQITSRIIFIVFFLLHHTIKFKTLGPLIVKILSFRAKI